MGAKLNKAKSVLKGIFSYKAAMWTFGILTLLLGIGLTGSITSLIALEGFVIIPLIGGLIKLVLFAGVLFGWVQFWLATRGVRRANDVVDTAGVVLNVGQKAASYGREKIKQRREKQPARGEAPARGVRGSSRKHF